MRVADFGVARALAEAAWTEPAGAMVGTARYISPEAAEGKPVDGRADVYSLALVLYEAVTGTVPFVTDTTMGTLAARLGQPLPAPRGAGPARRRPGPGSRTAGRRPGSTPRDWRPGWARWQRRCPRRRRSRSSRRTSRTRSPIIGVPRPGRLGAHRVGSRRDAPSARPPPSLRRSAAPRSAPRPVRARSSTPSRPGVGAPSRARGFLGRRTPSSGPPRSRSAGHVVDRGRGRAAVAIVAGGLAAASRWACSPRRTPRRTWSDSRWPRPRAALDKVHMDLRVSGSPVKSSSSAPGDVLSQSPKSGVSKKEGTTVSVVVSGGKPDVTVPSLANMTCAQPRRRCRPCTSWPAARRGSTTTREVHRHHLVVVRVHPEPDQGALRQHHHHRPLARTSAGDGPHHPDDLHLRAGRGRSGGGRVRGDGAPTRRTRPCRRAT